jgi:hypothetical protein
MSEREELPGVPPFTIKIPMIILHRRWILTSAASR